MLIITPSHIPRLHFPISDPSRTTHGRLRGDQPVTLLSRQSNINLEGKSDYISLTLNLPILLCLLCYN